jgi:hypothetical protein
MVAAAGASLTTLTAKAEINGTDSIEWMVADSDLVVRCRVAGVSKDWDADGTWWHRTVFEISETIKGQSIRWVAVRFGGVDPPTWVRSWQTSGEDGLLFLVNGSRAEGGEGVRHRRDRYAIRPGQWLLWPGRRPGRGGLGYTMDFRAVMTLDDACAAARQAAAANVEPVRAPPDNRDEWFRPAHVLGGPPGRVRLWAPSDSDADRELQGGSSVYLVAPLDARLERLAFAWIARRDEEWVSLAVHILRHFKSPQSTEVFKGRLNDRRYRLSGLNGRGTEWRHGGRELPFLTLRKWGVDVPRPPIDMPGDAYRPAGARLTATGAALAVYVLVAWGTLALVRGRRWRRRPAGWQHARPWLVAALLDAAIPVLLAAAVGAAGLHWRSRETVDELTFCTDGARHWVSAYRGGFQWVTIRDWPDRPPVSLAAFDLRASPEGPWTDGGVTVVRSCGRYGFHHLTGSVARYLQTAQSGGLAPSHAYASWRVPVPVAAAALAVLPAARAAVLVFGPLRRRRRHRKGLCPACGYDLRGGHKRCPECGEPVTPVLPSPPDSSPAAGQPQPAAGG